MEILEQATTQYRIGEVTVTRIPEITLNSAPDRLFPEWKPELIDGHEEWITDDSWTPNRTELVVHTHVWLVKTPQYTLLIDTAAGNDKSRPFAPYFDKLQVPFLERLLAAGIRPEDVDYVLITHIHTDHVGWNTKLVDGKWVPTFPNAKHFVSRKECESFNDPATRRDEQYSVYKDSVVPVIESGQVEMVEAGGGDVLPGFRYVPTPGHSLDHMSIVLESAGERAIFAGDVMHHPLQVYLPQLNSVYCEDAEKARNSRRWVLDHAAETSATYFSTHFPASGVGRIVREGTGFSWQYL
jgi:glyoxylase-like metal-dependent hydrolase (beta-lactamase superfamily II)